MKKLNILSIFMAVAVVLALAFTSCKKEEVKNSKSWNLTKSAPFVVKDYVADGVSRDSTYGLSFQAELKGGNSMAVMGLPPSVFYHALTSFAQNGQLNAKVSIADFGKAKSLSKVTSIPGSGEFKESVSLEVNHGYVMKVEAPIDLAAIGAQAHHPGLVTPATLYIRFCTEEELSGDGFKLSYQYPFVPEE